MSRKIHISLPSTGEEEWQATKEPIFSGWLTQGPKVAKFEENFAKKHNVENALATTSCTTGLHLILAGLGIGPGDEVLVPAFTWIATANVVLYCGAKPVFVDVDPETYNIDPKCLKEKVTDNTKAIIAVHLFGLCADIDSIRQSLPDSVHIIEDAACAAGASYKGKMAGGLGVAASFSFHPRKSITTGEGGMVTSNNSELSDIMNKLRNHGASISEEQRHHGPKPFLLPDFNLLGFNYRMTDLQGAVGLVQLEKLDGFLSERDKWAKYYTEKLSEVSWLNMPKVPETHKHAWQAFVTFVDPKKAPKPRNEIMEILQSKGISTRPGTHAVTMLNYYKDNFKVNPDDFPGAKLCDAQTMAIPLHNKMTQEDYDYIIQALKEI